MVLRWPTLIVHYAIALRASAPARTARISRANYPIINKYRCPAARAEKKALRRRESNIMPWQAVNDRVRGSNGFVDAMPRLRVLVPAADAGMSAWLQGAETSSAGHKRGKIVACRAAALQEPL